jgi:hypothetical protein
MYLFSLTCLNFRLVREIVFYFAKVRKIRLRNVGEISRNKLKFSRNTIIFYAKLRIAKFRVNPGIKEGCFVAENICRWKLCQSEDSAICISAYP